MVLESGVSIEEHFNIRWFSFVPLNKYHDLLSLVATNEHLNP